MAGGADGGCNQPHTCTHTYAHTCSLTRVCICSCVYMLMQKVRSEWLRQNAHQARCLGHWPEVQEELAVGGGYRAPNLGPDV